MTVLDHFTKYLWAEAFKTKEALPIAQYLLSIFRDGVCFPERWHADNGGEFKNFYIDAVRELLTVNSETRDGMLLRIPIPCHGIPNVRVWSNGVIVRSRPAAKSK